MKRTDGIRRSVVLHLPSSMAAQSVNLTDWAFLSTDPDRTREMFYMNSKLTDLRNGYGGTIYTQAFIATAGGGSLTAVAKTAPNPDSLTIIHKVWLALTFSTAAVNVSAVDAIIRLTSGGSRRISRSYIAGTQHFYNGSVAEAAIVCPIRLAPGENLDIHFDDGGAAASLTISGYICYEEGPYLVSMEDSIRHRLVTNL